MKNYIQHGCFIVAELSANHNGDLNVAIETIKAAKRAGADAIKLQTYTADSMTINVKNEHFLINKGTAWDGQYLYDLYLKAYTPWSWHHELFRIAKEEGLVCFSTPFDKVAVEQLETLDNPIYKVASFEITDIPLIEYIASLKKPVIFSTGIADISDIDLAVAACRKQGNDNISILKCTSAYPAEPEDANLLTIKNIEDRYDCISGLSDHTLGIEAPVVAVSLGARIIEKHLILNKEIGGPDAHFSLDENEFKKMVDAVRLAEKLIGKVDYEMTEKKKKSREFSRSLFVVEDVKAGDVLNANNVRSIRPGYGMHPKFYRDVMGKKFMQAIKKGTPLQMNLIH